jgi:PAS domain S-box-containing protein
MSEGNKTADNAANHQSPDFLANVGLTFIRRSSGIKLDLAIVVVLTLAAFFVSAAFNPAEQMAVWTTGLAHWPVNQIVTTNFIFSLGLVWFAYRRWRDLKVKFNGLSGRITVLQELEARYRTVIERCPACICLADVATGQILMTSQALERMLGYSRQELQGLTLADLVSDGKVRIDQAIQWALAGHDSAAGGYRYRRKDETLVDVEVSMSQISCGSGEVLAIVSTDITARKQAEAALRLSEERYTRAVSAGRVGIWDWNLDTDEFFLAPNFRTLLGFEDHKTDNHIDEWRRLIHPDDRDKVMAEAEAHLTGSRSRYEVEHRMLHKDGTIRWFLARGQVQFDANGRPAGLIGTDSDITDLKKAQEALARHAHEMAELYETSLEINAQPDLTTLLQAIVQRATQLLETRYGDICIVQPDRETLKLAAGHNQPEAYLGTTFALGEGLAGRVAQRGKPVMVADYDTWDGRASLEGISPIRRMLGVPLIQGDEVIGVLNVFDDEKVGEFDADEVRLLSLFAAQASTAIKNARLLAGEREQRVLAEALRGAGTALSATLDFNTVLDRLLDQIGRVVAYDTAAIMLVKNDRSQMARIRGYERFDPEIAREVERLSFEITSTATLHQIAETKQPLVIPDTAAYPEWVHVEATAHIRSWAGAPILVQDHVIAFFSVDKIEPNFYQPDDAERLTAFAGQAAIALENARLYGQLQQRLKEQTALRNAISVISSSLELDTVLNHITEQMGRAVDATSAYLCSYEPRTMTSTVLTEYFSPRASAEELISDLHLTYTLPRDFTESFDPLRVGQPEQIHIDDPTMIEQRRGHMQQYGAKTILNIPLMIGGQVMAFAELWESESRREFTAGEIMLCQSIAQQAAITMANADLYQQTRQQARQMQQIIDTIQEGILLLDPGYRAKLTNPAARTYLNQVARIDVGERLTHMGDRSLPELLAEPEHGRWHEVTIEGPPPQIFQIAAETIDGSSAPVGWVMVIRDVTEERVVQAQLQQQDRLATVGQLAAGIAHDFNNILTGILGFTELLRLQPDLPQSAHPKLEQIARSAEQAAHLTDQILDFSRRSVIKKQTINLTALLQKTIGLLERTFPEDIGITLAIEPDHAAFLVNGDSTQLQQVLVNLAINARDAMPAGGTLQFRLSRFSLQSNDPPPYPGLPVGEWLSLAVSDSGIGILPKHQPHIFEPFFTTKEVGQGTGLGLAQVYGIVKQHEGEIEVESQFGGGTTFILYLPVLSPTLALPPITKQPAVPRGQEEVILRVEDDLVVLRANEAILKHLGYQVLTAINGRQALAVYDSHAEDIALVVTDMTMPEMSGLALIQTLHQRNPVIKVVILTGYPLGEETAELVTLGVIDWLQKPVNYKQLAQAVSRALHMPADQ